MDISIEYKHKLDSVKCKISKLFKILVGFVWKKYVEKDQFISPLLHIN